MKDIAAAKGYEHPSGKTGVAYNAECMGYSIHVVHYEKGQRVEHDIEVGESKLVIPMVLVCRSPHHGTAKQPPLGGFAGGPRNIPLDQWGAMPPWFRDIKPGSPEQWDECHLPELDYIEPLPLAYRSPWASVSRASLAVSSRAMTIQRDTFRARTDSSRRVAS